MGTPASPSRTARPTWLTPAVIGFSVASFFSDFGHELVTALLPGFLMALGAPPVAIGAVESASNFGQAFSGLVGGSLASHSPRRQQWVVAGYLATAIKALIALVFWWPWVIVIRTAAWIGRGTRGPIRNTLIAEEVAPPHRGKAYGFREAWDTSGAVLGPVAAALLVSHWSSRSLIGWSALPGLVAVAAVLFWVRDRRPPVAGTVRERGPLASEGRRAIGALGQVQLGWVAPTLLILRVEQAIPQGGIPIAIGLYVIHNLTYALASYPAGAWTDRAGGGRILMLSTLLIILVMAGFALPGTDIIGWGALFGAAGVATAFWETAQKPWILERLQPAQHGRGFGQLAWTLGVAQLIGNVVVSGVWTVVGSTWAFALAALLTAIGARALFRVQRQAIPG